MSDEVINLVIFIMECLGVVSWSISGTLIALKRKMDFVGVTLLTLVYVFGGGVIRDLVMGRFPPAVFTETSFFVYVGICLFTVIICLILANASYSVHFFVKNENTMLLVIADAIGMAFFCVGGVQSGISYHYDNIFFLTFCGAITGFGGGILRDILCAEIPHLFRKHIYALPAIIGSFFYALLLRINFPTILASVLVVSAMIAIRILAAKFKWNLPALYKDLEREEQRVYEEKGEPKK